MQVIKLFEDRLLIRQLNAETKTAGGIIIPDTAKEKPTKGVVVDIGPDCKFVNIGQEVMYGKYAGSEVTFNGMEVIILRETDVMGSLQDVEELPESYKQPS